jgi:hypothetical protein
VFEGPEVEKCQEDLVIFPQLEVIARLQQLMWETQALIQVKEIMILSLELELESPTSIVGVLQLLPAAEKLLDPPGIFLPPGPRLSLPMLTKSRVFTNVEFLVAARVVSAPLKGVVLSIPGVDLAWLLNLATFSDVSPRGLFLDWC